MSERQKDRRNRDLGMGNAISRRDFVHGVALGSAGALGALAAPAWSEPSSSPIANAQDLPGYYPPRLTGLRGSHPGSFEAAHALRGSGRPAEGKLLDERYDAVIVGGGISGLSAAHFYLEREPLARVLILDNHDDFGGHAKRNEFELGGTLRLLNGGTLEIDSPRPYGPVADGVLRALGIDAAKMAKEIQHPEYYEGLGLGTGIFLDKETFGADHLAVGYRKRPWKEFLSGAPLSPAARDDIERIEAGSVDPLPELTSEQKKERLATISYRLYLKDVMKAGAEALAFYQSRTQGEWGVGADAVSALDAWGISLPGFRSLNLAPGSIPAMGFTPAGYADTGGSAMLHFPDGNATIARLLVRRLIPASIAGKNAEDVVSARAEYGQLDRADSPVRIRLNSTVVRVTNAVSAAGQAHTVITYMRDGQALAVKAKHCVLACYNMIIPFICPELPERQKAALHSLIKTPLVYTSVAIRNWRAFAKLGVRQIYAPGGYHTSARLNPTVDVGTYRSTRSPDEPSLVWMTRTPCSPGLTEHEQNKAGRAELLSTPFEVFERNIRDQLGRMLAGGGFDPATDITAITVNRWPHGYAPERNSLFEPLLPNDELPHVIGRARFGQIAIANSDSGGGAYTDVAIEQAHRAVHELLGA